MAKNYYDILGVSKGASPEEVKRAYRKLAGEHHPDRGGEGSKFKEINEAYQVLSDSTKRQQYDTYGQTFDQAQRQGGYGGDPFGGFDFSGGFGNGGVEFDFGDIFSTIFGGGGGGPQQAERRNRGIDLEMPLEISFEEAVFGKEQEVELEKKNKCERCEGSGAEPGHKVITCHKCHGAGSIKSSRRTILGTIATQTTCDNCRGSGKVPEKECSECKGSGVKLSKKKITITIPAGIENGQKIRVRGEGEAGYRGSENGDLYIAIKVRPSREFKRVGFNLHKEVEISFPQAALGDTVEVKTLDGDVKIKIPNGTQSGKVFKISGKGVPYLNRSGRGDLFVTVNVKIPEKLSKKQKDLIQQLLNEE
jgi:molecular chaperone DnaJ